MVKKKPNMSKALKGNSNGVKLKDAQVRQEAFKQYCAHIARGRPKEAWCFEHPQYTCTWKTLEKYIRDNPNEFPPIQKEIAHIKGYGEWFDKGQNMMEGKVEKCQPAIYQMIMRNMFEWDRESAGQKDESLTLMKQIAAKWREKK